MSGGGGTANIASRCGCYYEVMTDAMKTRNYLPQVNVAAHTTIFSTASETELVQTFLNPSKEEKISECRYVFPLYDGVSVVAFTCKVGSRLIHGVVKEKVEAQKVFIEAVSRGETAGILEQGPTTDVFVTALGNIPAGEKVQVNIKYVGELKHDLALQGIRFTLPTFISPRYGAGGPQGDMESSLAEGIMITVDINMPGECPIQEVRSPSHPIGLSLGRVSTQSDESSNTSKASATLALGTAALDKDFVLEVRHKDGGKARAFVETHPKIDGQRALMATLVPQMGKGQGEKPEIIIVADQSGSMQGGRTLTLVNALRVLLKSLAVGTKFNICAFGSVPTFLWEKSHVYDEQSLAEALRFIDTFSAHLGGTETLSAVQASMESRDSQQNLSMILATDGDIWQQEAFFSYLEDQLATSKKCIRVFPLGIGNSVSSGLIEGTARAGNGFASYVGEGEKLDSKIIRILKGAMTPASGTYTMEVKYYKDSDEDEYELVDRVIDSLRIMMVADSESAEGLAASAMVIDDARPANDGPDSGAIAAPKLLQAPQVLPPLYPLTRTVVYLLLSPQATRATPKSVIIRNDAPENHFEVAIPVETLSEPGTTIHSLAAKRAILELEEGRGWLSHAKDANDQSLKDVQPVEKYNELVKKEAVRLGVAYQITGKYTSCVAVESNTATEHGQQPTEQEVTITPRSDPPKPHAIHSSRIHHGLCAPPYAATGGGGSVRRQLASKPAAQCSPVPPPPPGPSSPPHMVQLASEPRKRKEAAGSIPPLSELKAQKKAARFSPPPPPAAAPASFHSARTPPAVASYDPTIEAEIDYERDSPSKDEDEEEDSSDNDDLVRADTLQSLIALQTFAGFWEYSETLLHACSVTVTEEMPPKGADSQIFATLLAVYFLEMKMAAEREVWELVVEKAKGWLDAKGVDIDGEGNGDAKWLRQLARKLIEEAG